jgi:hypothetical protein
MVNGNARPQPVQVGRFYETLVYRGVPQSGEDFSQSRTERLPGAATETEAWSRLFAALQHDRALIGGTVEILNTTEH